MPISLDSIDAGQAPAPWRTEYQETIALAIDVSRPQVEQWDVAMTEMTDLRVVRMYFGREGDAPWSLTFLRESDDSEHVALYRILYYFLRRIPGAVKPS